MGTGPTWHSCPYYDIVRVTAELEGLARCHSGYRNTTVPLPRGAWGSKALFSPLVPAGGVSAFDCGVSALGFFLGKSVMWVVMQGIPGEGQQSNKCWQVGMGR